MTPVPSTPPPPPHMHEECERRLMMTTTAAESEVLQQARLAEVINRELSEAPGTRRPCRLSQITASRLSAERICIGNLICIL